VIKVPKWELGFEWNWILRKEPQSDDFESHVVYGRHLWWSSCIAAKALKFPTWDQ